MQGASDPVDFDAFLLSVGKLNYTWTNTESLLIHLIAGLSGMDKEAATIVFLTLNTTRARLDLVDRFAKLERTSHAERTAVLDLTKRIRAQATLRNRYNHCIYAFDSDGGHPRSILMRIADRRDSLKIGQALDLDMAAAQDVAEAIDEIASINRGIWKTVKEFNYPV